MAGLGFGGRARPDDAVALDLTLDTFGGVDYVGHRRTEMALDFATTVFFNPHDPVQGFILAGLGWSRADVSYKIHEATPMGSIRQQVDQTYYYFGLMAGIGLEWRFEQRWGLDFALLGILRGRTDSNADQNPEYIDPKTKLATNSSGLGLLRLGLNYYF
jgi:opacity protein-like surface antigen